MFYQRTAEVNHTKNISIKCPFLTNKKTEDSFFRTDGRSYPFCLSLIETMVENEEVDQEYIENELSEQYLAIAAIYLLLMTISQIMLDNSHMMLFNPHSITSKKNIIFPETGQCLFLNVKQILL